MSDSVDTTSLLWQAGAYLRETVGGVSLGIDIGAQRAPYITFPEMSLFVQKSEVSIYATDVSLANTSSALKDLINLRATTVSLVNVETRVEALETAIDGGTYS